MFRPITRVGDAYAKAGMKKTQWHGAVKAGLMTPPFKLTERCAAVYDDEIAEVVAARAAGKTDEEIRALVRRQVAARQGVAA